MGNSSFTLQALVDIARTRGDIAPALPTGGSYETVALSAANDAMTAMLAGSDRGSPFNFKFNRILLPPFFVNSFQQDYASAVVNLGWLESCNAYNTSSTQYPKPEMVIEVRRDVLLVSSSRGRGPKISWMQNDTLTYGTWGQSQASSVTGLLNPGSGVVYTNPAGLTTTPVNPVTQVKDAYGNFWLLTTYGTCGGTNPFATNLNPVYPSFAVPTTIATTANDGGVVWTAINPKGQGFRLNPMPTQTGAVWQVAPIGQARIAPFTKMQQYLEPIPDDYFSYFKDGFFAQCYRYHPDPKIRAKFESEHTLWMLSLKRAVSQGSREEDDWGFVPSTSVMDSGCGRSFMSPANPYGW